MLSLISEWFYSGQVVAIALLRSVPACGVEWPLAELLVHMIGVGSVWVPVDTGGSVSRLRTLLHVQPHNRMPHQPNGSLPYRSSDTVVDGSRIDSPAPLSSAARPWADAQGLDGGSSGEPTGALVRRARLSKVQPGKERVRLLSG
jgi:hypothetical protein